MKGAYFGRDSPREGGNLQHRGGGHDLGRRVNTVKSLPWPSDPAVGGAGGGSGPGVGKSGGEAAAPAFCAIIRRWCVLIAHLAGRGHSGEGGRGLSWNDPGFIRFHYSRSSPFPRWPPAARGWKTLQAMSRILIPLDGSAASRAVLSVLPARLACYRTPVTLDLVHVRAPLAAELARLLTPEQQDAHHRSEGLALLEPLAAELRGRGDLALNLHVPVSALVPDALVALARALGVDEILMSTHGHGVEDKQFLGSVTSEVVRLASVPVALVGPGAGT